MTLRPCKSFTSHFTLNLDYIKEVFNLLIVKKKGFEFKDMQILD